MVREIKSVVVIRWDEAGEVSYHIADPDGAVAVVVVDERCPDDRCYEMLGRDDPEAVLALAPRPWGHQNDDKHAQAEARILFARDGLKVVGDSSPEPRDE